MTPQQPRPDGPQPDAAGRLSAPAALRNRDVIRDAVLRVAPASGHALEIASGTGEHVTYFAAQTPDLIWHPTDPDPQRRASIRAWRETSGLLNIRPPVDLDAAAPGWSAHHGPVDLILLVNLLHLIPMAAAQTVLAEIAAALAPGGVALIYGPFLRNGQTTSDGDASFDASLRAQDPLIGYKDVADIQASLAAAGLATEPPQDMPANNLILTARKPTPPPQG